MQHQDYDKLFKESFQRLSQVLLQTLLGMDTSSLQPVSTTLPRTIERRADFVAIGTHPITKNCKNIYNSWKFYLTYVICNL